MERQRKEQQKSKSNRRVLNVWEYSLVLVNPLKRAFAFQLLNDLSQWLKSQKKN